MKIRKLLFNIFMIPAFLLGVNNNTHEVKADATPVEGTRATLASSTLIKEAVSSVLRDSMNPEDASYLKTWKNISDVTITNDPNDIANKSNFDPTKYIGEPFEVGEAGTKTSVTSRTGNTKEFYVAGFLFDFNLNVGDAMNYYLVLYANVENIYANEISADLFGGMNELERLNLKCFNTKEVVDFSNMFADCHLLQDVSFLEKFNTPNAKNLSGMFSNCYWLKSIDFNNYPNFRSNNLENFEKMFYGCKDLESVNMSPLDGSKITNIRQMFDGCGSISKLDLSFITSQNIQYCYKAFNCEGYNSNGEFMEKIEELNISKMGLSNVVLDGPNGENELDLYLHNDRFLMIIYSPTCLPEGKQIELNSSFPSESHYITNESCNQRISNIPFIFWNNWSMLREEVENNLCEALVPGSFPRMELDFLLDEYKKMDPIDQATVDAMWDIEEENTTMKDSLDYFRAVIEGTQKTDGDYGLNTNNEGNNITLMSLENTNSAVIVIITFISSIVALISYATIMRKKYN